MILGLVTPQSTRGPWSVSLVMVSFRTATCALFGPRFVLDDVIQASGGQPAFADRGAAGALLRLVMVASSAADVLLALVETELPHDRRRQPLVLAVRQVGDLVVIARLEEDLPGPLQAPVPLAGAPAPRVPVLRVTDERDAALAATWLRTQMT